ncbi:MAG: class I SAM-dependent methyltransferase [Candidatus Gracilibacteria bacterium]|nr:class I SAM-dependent methyltransferase [Candidatus Gracilibacteria bacterium]MDD2908216.1 class I SAM-dependent methyltransferase [Candidatus Gracilibacteria bacterium]
MVIISLIFHWIFLIFWLLVLIGATFYLLSGFIATIQASGVPYVPSYNEDLARMKEKLSLDLTGKTMIDLGCGDGKALRFFVKNFGIKSGVGYDFNLWAILYGKILNKFLKTNSIELHKGNFLKVDISKYDYIYVYLLSEYLEKIEDFVFSNMRDDAIVISNTFKFKNHTPYEVTKSDKGRDRILLYKKES